MRYNKVCNLEDWTEAQALIAEFYPRNPLDRKAWEIAMAIRTITRYIDEYSEVLGIGAGFEETSFYLTNKAKRVFATDIYLTPGRWIDWCNQSMMITPEQYYQHRWNKKRLVVQHMNGLDLQYEDSSFDALYSSSSIEHFGDFTDVNIAVGEMFRVLKPGGILSLSTEFKLEGNLDRFDNVLLFTKETLHKYIIDPWGWKMIDDFDATVSDATYQTRQRFPESLTAPKYPHIVLQYQDFVWTSCHLALIKC